MKEDSRSTCAYCGLPLPGSLTNPPASQPRFCCFGCRFAATVTKSTGEEGQQTYALTKLGLAIFFTLNVIMLTMVLWSPDIYGGDPHDPWSRSFEDILRYVVAFLAVPVLWLLGQPLWLNSWEALLHRRMPMDLLLLLGVIAAYIYSFISTFSHAGAVYFEVGCVVLVLVTLGRWLEATGKQKTTAALASLDRVIPATAIKIDANQESSVSVEDIQTGDRLRILSGDRVPCDGLLLSDHAQLNQQLITGESQPREVEKGGFIPAGALNVNAAFNYQVQAPVQEGTLARFAQLVRNALMQKSRYERLADRVSQVFLPGVIVLALITACGHGFLRGLEHGIMSGLAVILIACPCALGIATPLALWTAMGQAAQKNILIRSIDALERLPKIRLMAFDKTGTITTGQPEITKLVLNNSALQNQVLSWTVRLTRRSNHPLAKALHQYAKSKTDTSEHAADGDEAIRFIEHKGLGLMAVCRGAEQEVRLGSHRLMQQGQWHWPPVIKQAWHEAEQQGLSVVFLGWNRQVQALYIVHEEIRVGAAEALRQLRLMGLEVIILTGDHQARARNMSSKLEVEVRGELLPEDKVQVLKDERQSKGMVAMIGDGLNDAPALAESDLGLAMACGTDLTRETADICLLSNQLERIPWLVELGRRTELTIRLNLFWALIYNVAGLGLACMGWLNPIWASLAMVLSSSFVVVNSLKLRNHSEPLAAVTTKPSSLANDHSVIEALNQEKRAQWLQEIQTELAENRT